MKPIELIAQDIFDKVRSRFDNLEMGDEEGGVTTKPSDARFFDFDFIIEGNRLGRVTISINQIGNLKIFYGQGILDKVDSIIRESWYDFLREMRNFAKRRMLRFDTRDITKANLNKSDFKYLADKGTKEEQMKESIMHGSSRSSYLPIERTRLIIRHSKPVDIDQRGSRSRNINSIYIENQEGERYKMKYNNLAGAKLLQRHVANGGKPHDEIGQRLEQMIEQVVQLSAFKRKVGKHDTLNSGANDILDRTAMKLENLRHQIHTLSKQKNYESWKESLENPMHTDIAMDAAALEDYKSKFTVNSFNEDLSQYFPLIYSVMQEAGDVDLADYVKETMDDGETSDTKNESAFDAFENWASSVVEGTLTPDNIADLKSLIDDELTLGTKAINAIQSLKNIGINDSDLNSALVALSAVNQAADPLPTISAWLLKFDPAAAQELNLGEPEQGAEQGVEQEPEQGVEQEPEQAPQAGSTENPQTEPVTDESTDKSGKKYNTKELAEMISSFYDKETNKFPIGETSVITKVGKEFGDEAKEIAEKFINKLCEKNSDDDELSRMAQLSGSTPAMDRVSQRVQARKHS